MTCWKVLVEYYFFDVLVDIGNFFWYKCLEVFSHICLRSERFFKYSSDQITFSTTFSNIPRNSADFVMVEKIPAASVMLAKFLKNADAKFCQSVQWISAFSTAHKASK